MSRDLDSKHLVKMARKSKAHSHLSSGSGFIQVKKKYLLKAWLDLARPNAAMMTWIWLNANCTLSNVAHMHEKRMVAEIEFSRASLYNALKELEDRNFIWREGGKIHLNKDMVWHGRIAASVFTSRCFGDPKDLVAKPSKTKQVKPKTEEVA